MHYSIHLLLTLASYCLMATIATAWSISSSDYAIDNKDFPVLEAELPPIGIPLTAGSHAEGHVQPISNYIWHHAGQELWFCGTTSASHGSGLFKRMQEQDGHLRLVQQGRYQLRVEKESSGELWLMGEDGSITHHQWQQLEDLQSVDYSTALIIDGKRYVSRALTSMESTCPPPVSSIVGQSY